MCCEKVSEQNFASQVRQVFNMRCKQAQLLATTAVLLLACHRANAFGSALDDITKSFQSKCNVLGGVGRKIHCSYRHAGPPRVFVLYMACKWPQWPPHTPHVLIATRISEPGARSFAAPGFMVWDSAGGEPFQDSKWLTSPDHIAGAQAACWTSPKRARHRSVSSRGH